MASVLEDKLSYDVCYMIDEKLHRMRIKDVSSEIKRLLVTTVLYEVDFAEGLRMLNHPETAAPDSFTLFKPLDHPILNTDYTLLSTSSLFFS